MKARILILFCTSLSFWPSPVEAQLNTGGAPYLTTVAAASSLESSPYAVPKKVAQLDDSLFADAPNKKYDSAIYQGYEYAVYTNKRGKHKAFQILISNDDFTLLCQHYAEKDCDCREGLSIAGINDEKPSTVRQLLPFSLKTNLVEVLNKYGKTNLDAENFDEVCDIIEYLKKN